MDEWDSACGNLIQENLSRKGGDFNGGAKTSWFRLPNPKGSRNSLLQGFLGIAKMNDTKKLGKSKSDALYGIANADS